VSDLFAPPTGTGRVAPHATPPPHGVTPPHDAPPPHAPPGTPAPAPPSGHPVHAVPAFVPPGAPTPFPPPSPLPTRGPSAATVGVVAALVGLTLGVAGGVWLGRTVPGPPDAPAATDIDADTAESDADTGPDTTDSDATPRATTEPGVVVDRADPADYPDGGGPTNPWPFDATYTGDRWEVEVGTPWDATVPVLAHDPDTVGPPDGSQYWVVPLAATYSGHLPVADASDQVDVVFVDRSGVVHADGCGAVPDALADAPDVASGETAEGRLCVTVPVGADGLWKVTVAGTLPFYLSTES
jgi:hypothetical protein